MKKFMILVFVSIMLSCCDPNTAENIDYQSDELLQLELDDVVNEIYDFDVLADMDEELGKSLVTQGYELSQDYSKHRAMFKVIHCPVGEPEYNFELYEYVNDDNFFYVDLGEADDAFHSMTYWNENKNEGVELKEFKSVEFSAHKFVEYNDQEVLISINIYASNFDSDVMFTYVLDEDLDEAYENEQHMFSTQRSEYTYSFTEGLFDPPSFVNLDDKIEMEFAMLTQEAYEELLRIELIQ